MISPCTCMLHALYFQIPKEAGYIRSIVAQNTGGTDGKFYIGTTNSAILEGSLQDRIKFILEVKRRAFCGTGKLNI